MTKLSVPAAIVLSSLLASSASSAGVTQQLRRLRKTNVHRSGSAGAGGSSAAFGVADDHQQRRQLAKFESLSASISMADLSASIDVTGEMGPGPVVVVPTAAPVESTVATTIPTIIVDAGAASLSMSLPGIEDLTESPTPATTDAATTLPPVATTAPPVYGFPTMPPVDFSATPPPVPNLFGTTPPPTFMSMPAVDLDMSLSLPDDDATSPPTPPFIPGEVDATSPPTPFVSAGSTPTVGTDSTSEPVTPPPSTPPPAPELLPITGESGSSGTMAAGKSCLVASIVAIGLRYLL